MKIFLDTANIEEISRGVKLGVVDGVTTNPSLLAKEKRPREEIIREIVRLVNGPVSVEVVSENHEEMIREGMEIAQIHPNVVVKIPMTEEEPKATKELSREGVSVNVTLIFQPLQALLACKAGARFVSPFIGRLDDIGHEGITIIPPIRQIIDIYGFETQILAASIRHPVHVLQSALEGADCATMPFKVFEQLWKHPLTEIGLAKFLKDYYAVFGEGKTPR